MLLPDGAQAVVEDAKLLEYVLNLEHPVGRHHAVLFAQLLGITRANYGLLKKQLLLAAVNVEVEAEQASPFSEKFAMRLAVRGPLGTRPVLAVWIREPGATGPRLITYYVE